MSETITLKKDTLWKVAAGVFAVLFLVVLFGGFSFKDNGTGNVVDTGSNNQGPVNAKSLIESNDPVLGDPNAEISIVEFSDFQCPFCARAATGALAEFRQSSYFADGDVNLVYKQFPLNSIHPYAQKAGEASLCANAQDAFWEYHDALFANQASLDVASLKSYASQLGLNTEEFNTCLDDGDFASEVSKETAQATSAGGRGTPFFVIVNTNSGDATTVSGAVPWANFEAAIQSVQ